MKTTTYLRILFLGGFFIQGSAFAQTYPVYLCGTATVTLKPTNVTITGEQIVWVETTTGSDVPVQSGTTQNYTTPTNLSVGEHSYKVYLVSAAPNSCPGDASTVYKIYKLPTSTLTLAGASLPRYCENSGSNSTMVATSAPAAGQSLPTGVGYAYTWTATKDGASIASSSVGSNATSAFTNTFTVNTTTTGTYVLSVAANYTVPTGSTLKSSDSAGCSVTATGTNTITVAPKPGQPTIDFQ
jgi:hypothetical protein